MRYEDILTRCFTTGVLVISSFLGREQSDGFLSREDKRRLFAWIEAKGKKRRITTFFFVQFFLKSLFSDSWPLFFYLITHRSHLGHTKSGEGQILEVHHFYSIFQMWELRHFFIGTMWEFRGGRDFSANENTRWLDAQRCQLHHRHFGLAQEVRGSRTLPICLAQEVWRNRSAGKKAVYISNAILDSCTWKSIP